MSGAFVFVLAWLAASAALSQGDAKRGEYLAKAGGCAGCHTSVDGPSYAGGRALDTPFGTFYGPNITPHAQAGIGRWSEADFVRALRHGRRPDGAHYFPAFPYTSFTFITDPDLRDLWAYLRTLTPSERPNRDHDLGWFYRWRFLVGIWKWLFFAPGPFTSDPAASPMLDRGRYLVTALGHCGECHTARNFLGALKRNQALAGAKLAEGRAPNLTPTGLKKWNDSELASFLRTGSSPEGDATSDVMYEVVRNTTSQLRQEDLGALVAYLRSLPPLPEAAK